MMQSIPAAVLLATLASAAVAADVAMDTDPVVIPPSFSFQRPDVQDALARCLGGDRPLARAASDDSEAGTWYRLVMKIGRHPRYRHTICKAINARGGYLDRKINAKLLEREWQVSDVPNLDTVTTGLLRGGQPNAKGFEKLRSMGITTVVNLRFEDNDEEPLVRKLGMTPAWLPIPDTCAPAAEQVKKLHELVDQPGARVYVHCSAGVFRTGTMIASYRIAHGMSLADALAEMKAHKFDPEWLCADREVAFLTSFAQEHPPRAATPVRSSPAANGRVPRVRISHPR